MSAEGVVDAEVVPDVDGAEVSATGEASTQLVRRERRSEVIKPLDAGELVESFKSYQSLLPQLLDESDYQSDGKDKFVKKSGWRKIATAFDLDVQLVRSSVERDESGEPVRAEVWARAIAPSGRSMDGDGYCSVGEKRFANPKGRQKLENDLRATATTRAMNRAISGLVGMGAVSAEEVDSAASTQGPPFGPETSNGRLLQVRTAIGYLLKVEHTDERVTLVLREIAKEAGGYLPEIATAAVCRTARMVKEGTATSLEEQPSAEDELEADHAH
jgi:hypothetical protein